MTCEMRCEHPLPNESTTESADRQQRILDGLPAHVAVLDAQGTIVQVNAAWRRFAAENGYAGEDCGLGANYLAAADLVPSDEASPSFAWQLRRVLAGHLERFTLEYPCHSATEQRWFAATVTAYRYHGGHGAIVAHTDVTARIHAESRLYEMASAFDSSGQAMLVCDQRMRIRTCNPAYAALVGAASLPALAGTLPTFMALAPQGGDLLEVLEQCGRWRGDLLVPGGDGGHLFTASAEISPVRGPSADGGYVVCLSNTAELHELQQTVDRLSFRDPVTGLPNRNALERWLQVRRLEPGDRPLAGVRFALGRVRIVNEVYGYDAGDALLREVGRRLQAFAGPHDFVCRLRGNEFVIILDGVSDPRRAELQAQAILQRLMEPVLDGARSLSPSLRAGLCLWPEQADTREALARCSDAALTVAKSMPPGSLVSFKQEMLSAVGHRMAIEAGLREALRTGAIELHFQPIIDLSDGRIEGYEALARWTSPSLGRVPPDVFIAVAEETGLILQLGEQVLEAACRWIAGCRAAGAPVGWVAVNLSPAQLLDASVTATITRCLARHDVDPAQLKLEVTESLLVTDRERAASVLGELRAMGVSVALDDFGTGYSSLGYLKKFPIDAIKLDRSFVSGIGTDPVADELVSTIIGLAQRLGLRCVAEGVEDEAHSTLLRQWGCDSAQGYLYGKPMPAAEAIALQARELERSTTA